MSWRGESGGRAVCRCGCVAVRRLGCVDGCVSMGVCVGVLVCVSVWVCRCVYVCVCVCVCLCVCVCVTVCVCDCVPVCVVNIVQVVVGESISSRQKGAGSLVWSRLPFPTSQWSCVTTNCESQTSTQAFHHSL